MLYPVILLDVNRFMMKETCAAPADEKLFPVYSSHIREVTILQDYVGRMMDRKKAENAAYDAVWDSLVTNAIKLAVLRTLLTHPRQEIVYLPEEQLTYLKKVCKWSEKYLK